MIGPREELLRDRTLGSAGIALLYRTVRQVVRVRNLPAPDGRASWSADDLQEAAHDIFAARKGPERLLALAVRGTDEESFRAQLWVLVANELASRNRKTARGKLHERLRNVVAGMPDVTHDAKTMRLAGVERADQAARFDELIAAASSVTPVVPPWDPMSEHEAPIADSSSLQAMIRAVLAATGAGLTLGDLTAVVAVRLGVHDAPVHRDHDGWERIAPVAPDDPAADVEAGDAAERLLSLLTPREQHVLPFLDESTTGIADATGLGRTTAYKTAEMARFKIRQALAQDPDAPGTLAAAAQLARARWESVS